MACFYHAKSAGSFVPPWFCADPRPAMAQKAAVAAIKHPRLRSEDHESMKIGDI
jgi:hypothetical protein